MGKFAEFLGNMANGRGGALLAPMAGITDLGMRRAAQIFGASYVCSEMVDSRFCAEDGGRRAAGHGLACHVVQIAGCSPATLADAARFAEGHGADAVDINMGCPAKKVVGGQAGSALMRDLDQATRLIGAVRAAVSVPVTVKMRLGWDDDARNAPDLARRAEREGVSLVTVHGRTRCQFYGGRADWRAIRDVVDAVAIPVVANGDCDSVEDARAMLAASGAAAVMIGRAAVGRPWLVGEIARALEGANAAPAPSRHARCQCAVEHYAMLLSTYGMARGVRHARKHLAGYATHAGVPAGTALHAALVTAEQPAAVFRLLENVFDTATVDLAA